MKDVERIRDITVGHMFRELSRFAFCFIHEAGTVTGTVASITTKRSLNPAGGLVYLIL